MDKPASIILDLRLPLAEFRRKAAPLVEGKIVRFVEEVVVHVLANIFDNCENWDRHSHAMCRTAGETVQRRFYLSDYEARRELYMAITELSWEIAAKIEFHNLEEYGEFYYAFERRLPNDAILLSQFWAPGSRADWGGRRHATT